MVQESNGYASCTVVQWYSSIKVVVQGYGEDS